MKFILSRRKENEKRRKFVCYGGFFIIVVLVMMLQIKKDREKIELLQQNNYEQIEEKEVYRNRCKMLEDLIEGSGLVIDECECR